MQRSEKMMIKINISLESMNETMWPWNRYYTEILKKLFYLLEGRGTERQKQQKEIKKIFHP